MIYEELERNYETQFSRMSITPEGVRYLKIRTLIDVETLKANRLLRETFAIKKNEIKRASLGKLRRDIFLNREITDSRLNELLRKVYEDLKLSRGISLEDLKSSLSKIADEGDNYWNAWNSVYRDDIRQHIQHHFIRTINIQSYEELLRRIDRELDTVVKGYTIISWFNQWSSAIIEQFILSHPKVVPTARRIDKVDFFFLDVPIDLKITFVPAEYIALSIRNGIISNPEQIVGEIQDNSQRLIKWLYENQGEPRFSDSHRVFVVLADAENLDRSWKLKASFDLIQKGIDDYLLNHNSRNDIPYTDWEFKGDRIRGRWKTYSDLILIIR